jgi:hypothetical protein
MKKTKIEDMTPQQLEDESYKNLVKMRNLSIASMINAILLSILLLALVILNIFGIN